MEHHPQIPARKIISLPPAAAPGPVLQPTNIRSLPTTPPAGPVLAAALEDRWHAYRKQLRHCQAHVAEETVHELRVATRRLLAQFVLLECVAPSSGLAKARRALKSRLTDLGELRDTHVQLQFIKQKLTAFPELAHLGTWLKRRERRLVKAAADTIHRCKTRKLEKWISASAEALTTNKQGARAQHRFTAAVFRATARAFAQAIRRRRAIDPQQPRTIHQTRVAFKRFRYMVESLSPALTGLTKRQLRALAYYQRRMGIIQDLEVLRRCVAAFASEHERAERRLRPFSRHLQRRRARALRSFINSADCLFDFWPPVRLTSPPQSSRTLSEA